MTINADISLGNILTIISLLGTQMALHQRNVERLTRLDERLETVWKWWLEEVTKKKATGWGNES
jgi:hypothetical protein